MPPVHYCLPGVQKLHTMGYNNDLCHFISSIMLFFYLTSHLVDSCVLQSFSMLDLYFFDFNFFKGVSRQNMPTHLEHY